jgi:hypothetical protein
MAKYSKNRKYTKTTVNNISVKQPTLANKIASWFKKLVK